MRPQRWARFLKNLAVSQRYQVDGLSMVPALCHGQHVLAKRLGPDSPPVQRGNIVVFRHPSREGAFHIKRVVGLPLESVSLRDGTTYVNGRRLDEPYSPGCGAQSWRNRGEWTMEAGQYFVMGDNRGDSEDSRRYGPIEHNLVVGMVWLGYWPPRKWAKY